ncbi:hypothetical protein [Brachybacterium sp. Z12]|uniref:Y-family DNA polymerase n=1 Tax=Brachybacterium sp. Z12 TaxID=2759167 RepID=UPI00223BE562|nr:hypothetical protein [Brachybacterium sp. Z12]
MGVHVEGEPREEIPGILHLDMDAFFASVEVRDDPRLQGLPVVVGGAGARGVVAAASYPARTRGIRSAMPMATARRLAPDLVIVPPRIDQYRRVSSQVMDLLGTVVADFEQISVDEAFLDVRGARRLFGEPGRSRICSAGGSGRSSGCPARSVARSPALSRRSPPRRRSPTGCSSSQPHARPSSSPRCRSPRSQGWARRRRPHSNGSGCARSASSGTFRRPRSPARWAHGRPRSPPSPPAPTARVSGSAPGPLAGHRAHLGRGPH